MSSYFLPLHKQTANRKLVVCHVCIDCCIYRTEAYERVRIKVSTTRVPNYYFISLVQSRVPKRVIFL